MTHLIIETQRKPSPAIRAEAALWLAHLRGPERDADVERGFRLWLEAQPEHAIAFEIATEVWERSGGLRRRPRERALGWTRPGYWRDPRSIAVTAALVLGIMAAAMFYLQRNMVTTAVGEQRTLTLEDGTRIFLNTDTRAIVEYDAQQRRVKLERGEALFEVAQEAARPFRVSAGTAQIEALGTSFVVRRDPQQLAITLVEGTVSVAPTEGSDVNRPQERRILRPGERLTMGALRPAVVDAPVLDKLTAWQHGQIAFDNTPLADAVAEMNRYSTLKLTIEQPKTASIPIGGVFRTGDAISFAQAMAETYQLRVIEEGSHIVLTGAAETPARSNQRPH